MWGLACELRKQIINFLIILLRYLHLLDSALFRQLIHHYPLLLTPMSHMFSPFLFEILHNCLILIFLPPLIFILVQPLILYLFVHFEHSQRERINIPSDSKSSLQQSRRVLPLIGTPSLDSGLAEHVYTEDLAHFLITYVPVNDLKTLP